MPQLEPTAELNEGFSAPEGTARPWAETVEARSKAEIFWLSTVRGNGRPHVTPIPAIWLDGTLYFCVTVGGQEGQEPGVELLLRANDRHQRASVGP
jgi:hypothetical protein